MQDQNTKYIFADFCVTRPSNFVKNFFMFLTIFLWEFRNNLNFYQKIFRIFCYLVNNSFVFTKNLDFVNITKLDGLYVTGVCSSKAKMDFIFKASTL